jgi:eukaryotic-like serine/threonine-protein kinase
VRSGVPRTLSVIAARAMARDPDERYQAAAELAGDLRRWIDRHSSHEVVPASAALPLVVLPPLADAGQARHRRKPGGWRSPLVLAMAVLVAAALVWVAGTRTSTQAPATDATPEVASVPSAPVLAPKPPVAAPPAAVVAATTTTESGAETAPPAAITASPPALSPASASAPINVPAEPAAARPSPPRPALPAAARPKATAVNAGHDNRRPAALTATAAAAPATGLVQLAISPWGQVEVDGQPAGITPPLTRLTLGEGTHTVTVRNEDFPPHTVTVQVQADKPVVVRHRFGQ